MTQTVDLILNEVRELRGDYNKHARDTGERLASLESQMYSLCGNGQPGRIALLETAVEALKRWRWYLAGMGTASVGLGTIAGGLAGLLVELLR